MGGSQRFEKGGKKKTATLPVRAQGPRERNEGGGKRKFPDPGGGGPPPLFVAGLRKRRKKGGEGGEMASSPRGKSLWRWRVGRQPVSLRKKKGSCFAAEEKEKASSVHAPCGGGRVRDHIQRRGGGPVPSCVNPKGKLFSPRQRGSGINRSPHWGKEKREPCP